MDGRCGLMSCREMKVRLREDGLRDGFGRSGETVKRAPRKWPNNALSGNESQNGLEYMEGRNNYQKNASNNIYRDYELCISHGPTQVLALRHVITFTRQMELGLYLPSLGQAVHSMFHKG